MNKLLPFAWEFAQAFIVTAGGAYMTASSNGTPITQTAAIGFLVLGLVAGAKAVDSLRKEPPP